jgi:hypothetical protein
MHCLGFACRLAMRLAPAGILSVNGRHQSGCGCCFQPYNEQGLHPSKPDCPPVHLSITLFCSKLSGYLVCFYERFGESLNICRVQGLDSYSNLLFGLDTNPAKNQYNQAFPSHRLRGRSLQSQLHLEIGTCS